MAKYPRNTLSEFLQPIEMQDLHDALESSWQKTAICDLRPRRTIAAHHLQKDFGIPDQVIIDHWSASEFAYPDTSALLAGIQNWQANASQHEKYVEICEALMHRSEHSECNKQWQNVFSAMISETFQVGPEVGLETIETPPRDGMRWTRIVAVAAADRILASEPAT